MVSAPGTPVESQSEVGPSAWLALNDALPSLAEPLESPALGESGRESNSQNSALGIVGWPAASNVPSPNHASHQHASLFYLSLIEGRCRTQATHLVNARRRPGDKLPEDHLEVRKVAERLFGEMSKELLKAGLLPQRVGVAVPTFHELRRYLASFDTILNDIAIQQSPDMFDGSAYRAIEDSNSFSFGSEAVSSLFERSQPQSQALVAQRLNMAHLISPQAGLAPSPFHSAMRPVGRDGHHQMSPYDTKFREICLLGKGGFGRVYRAHHIVDDQEYAIKQLRVSAGQLHSILHNETRRDELLLELRALAKLQHNNVVRYFDSWLEARPASQGNMTQNQRLLGGRAHSSGDTNSDSDGSGNTPSSAQGELTTDFHHLQITQENQLRKEAKRARKDSIQKFTNDASIIFENSSPSISNAAVQKSTPHVESKPTYQSKLFRKPTDNESDDDDEITEEVERNTTQFQPSQDDKDLIIFIQMAQYPMTLEEFIWAELKNGDNTACPGHCFHTATTARVLLAILEGVEYIHSQHIVHRDLKPSNIFLSVSRAKQGPERSINLKACPECGPSMPDEHLFIIPHIGDFGLIAKLDVSSPQQTPQDGFQPSPLAVLSSVASRQPGTKFYCAPNTVTNTICPKLDVYSLGVIALELSMKFGTKSERLNILSKLNKGELEIDGLVDHQMAPGIKGMLSVDPAERWNCHTVRKWLIGVLGEY